MFSAQGLHRQTYSEGVRPSKWTEALRMSRQGLPELSEHVPRVGVLFRFSGQVLPCPSAANSIGGSMSQSPEFAMV